MTDDDRTALKELQVAKTCVDEAETDLAKLLNELEVTPRAEKTAISNALRQAFQKLRDAREHLGKLEALIRTDEG